MQTPHMNESACCNHNEVVRKMSLMFFASFRNSRRLFSDRRIEKEPLQQTETPLVHRRETCSDMTLLFTSDLYENWRKIVTVIIFHPSSCMICVCESTLHFSLISIKSNGSFRAKYIKGSFIGMDRKMWKSKRKCCTYRWKPYTSHSHMFTKTKLINIIVYLLIYNRYKSIFILQFWYRQKYWDSLLYETKPLTLLLNNIFLLDLTFQAQLNGNVVAKSIQIFNSTQFHHEITKETESYIKPSYLEILLFLYNKLISNLFSLGMSFYYKCCVLLFIIYSHKVACI